MPASAIMSMSVVSVMAVIVGSMVSGCKVPPMVAMMLFIISDAPVYAMVIPMPIKALLVIVRVYSALTAAIVTIIAVIPPMSVFVIAVIGPIFMRFVVPFRGVNPGTG